MAKRPGVPHERVPAAGGIADRLARVLDAPHLAKVVPRLPAETLHRVIRDNGVEHCGALLAAATPAQLVSVLDLDLWRSADASLDEQFDAARFLEWIEGLAEGGETRAADIASRIDVETLVRGLSAYIRVFDPATLSAPAFDDEMPDEATPPRPGPSMDIDGYVVHARVVGGWDAIVSLLTTLASDHHDHFQRVMRGCRRLSDSAPEVDGLHGLLVARGQIDHDLADARADRRTRKGFLSAAEARAFLQLARKSRGDGVWPSPNPIAAAYFRAGDHEGPAGMETPAEDDAPVAGMEGGNVDTAGTVPDADEAAVRDTLNAVDALVAEPAAARDRPRGLLVGTAATDDRRTRLQRLLDATRVSDPRAFAARTREAAFLANALMAGCALQARPFSPTEASDATLSCCNLGFDVVAPGQADPEAFLADHDLVTLFERGWAALHEASLFVARTLAEVLRSVQSLDTKTHQGLVILRRDLARCCAMGTPWGVRDSLDVLAILDTVAWTGLLGALDECPVVPDALTAVVERRRGAVSATSFAFVATVDQLATMRAFAERLPEVLLGA